LVTAVEPPIVMAVLLRMLLDDAEVCKERARRCLERARSAPSLSIATRFEDAAHSWLRLAEDLESVEVLLDEQRAAIKRR
jgi:Mg2+ and Co2+ transporter CorA